MGDDGFPQMIFRQLVISKMDARKKKIFTYYKRAYMLEHEQKYTKLFKVISKQKKLRGTKKCTATIANF